MSRAPMLRSYLLVSRDYELGGRDDNSCEQRLARDVTGRY